MSYDLDGRTVAITGAAGSLGVALAAALRAEGARVALLDLDGDRVAARAADLGGPRGWIHPPLLGAYAASKAGVWALCDALRLELRTTGVTVGSVHPVIFRTPMIGDALDAPAAVALVDDFRGVFRTVPVETVVADIVRGLRRRSARVVTPRRLGAAALAPGLVQAVVERVFFRPATIRRAVELGAVTAPEAWDPGGPGGAR